MKLLESYLFALETK